MHGNMSRAYLRQLEDVLLAVDDLEPATRQPSSHIATVQPAILVQHLPSLLLILEVPLENGGAPHTDLQSWDDAIFSNHAERNLDKQGDRDHVSWPFCASWCGWASTSENSCHGM